MTQPTPYRRGYDFSDAGGAQPPGGPLDGELDALSRTLRETLRNLALLQRDDTGLRNGIVGIDALDNRVLGLLSGGTFSIAGTWATATAYAAGAFFSDEEAIYLTMEAHTSTSIVSDLAAGHIVKVLQNEQGERLRDDFTGNGVQTAFTLSQSPSRPSDVEVYVEGLLVPADDYVQTGATVTFDVAPANGLDISIFSITWATAPPIQTLVDAVGDRNAEISAATQFLADVGDGAPSKGASLIATEGLGDVQSDLDARPTAADLAAPTGGGMVGNRLPAGSNLRTQPVSDFIDNNILQPSQFAGTAEQQLTRAITEANASRNGGQGQTVQLARGEVTTTAPFNLASRVMLKGVSKRGTRIKADAAFSGSYMVTVNDGTSSMFDNPLERLTLDCNDVASLGGVDSEAWQEGAGLRDVLIQKFCGIGVYFHAMDGGAALCEIVQSEIFGSASNCVAGIRIDDSISTQSFQLRVVSTTLSGGGAAATSMPKAIDLIKGSLFVKNCHVENCTTGVYVDGAGVVEIDGLTGASTAGGVTNLVEIASTFTGTLKMTNCKRNGATNLVKDNRVGGFGTITGYDTDFFIQQEPTVGRGSIVASASIDGTGTPSVSKGFGIASITDNGTGDYTVFLTRSGQAAGDFTVFASTNQGAGNVRCDLNGVNSVRFRCFAADGTTPTDVNELKILVVRVA